MTRILAQAVTAASPDRAFDYRADPASIPEWNSTYPRVESTVGDPGVVGSQFTLVRVNGRLLKTSVVEAERPRRLVTESVQNGIKLRLTTEFTAVAAGTRVDAAYEYRVPWSRGGPIADRFLRRHIEGGLRASTGELARRLDGGAGRGAG